MVPAPPSRRPRTRRRRTVAALSIVLAASSALTACGGSGDHEVAAAARGQLPAGSVATAEAFTLSGQWPLTGEPLDGDAPGHPVYVVKMDNTPSAAPQVGLGSADMVVEELVEGGLTRLAAFFYSDIPSVVGPVRSTRASDVGIVKPAAATIVASGGASRTGRLLAGHDVSTVTENSGGKGFYRDGNRAAPYDLFARLPRLVATTGKSWLAPTSSYLQFGAAADFSGTVPVKSVVATFSGSHTTSWRSTDQGWVRQGAFARTGDDFVADNVLLLRVKVSGAGYLDPAGNPVPETSFYGTGQAILVHGDSALRCTWTKSDPSSTVHLSTGQGAEVTVPAGHTWIELMPSDSGTVTLNR